jgi:hypothetical protein
MADFVLRDQIDPWDKVREQLLLLIQKKKHLMHGKYPRLRVISQSMTFEFSNNSMCIIAQISNLVLLQPTDMT